MRERASLRDTGQLNPEQPPASTNYIDVSRQTTAPNDSLMIRNDSVPSLRHLLPENTTAISTHNICTRRSLSSSRITVPPCCV